MDQNRRCIDDYGDILYLQDVMEYLQIGRDTALDIFNSPGFPELIIDNKRKRVLKADFVRYLAETAALP